MAADLEMTVLSLFQRRRLEWWHAGRDFVVAPSIDQEIGEDQKKRSLLQNELVFGTQVCDDKKKPLRLPISRFSVSKEKNTQMVSPQNSDTRGGPPPLATPLVFSHA